MSTSVEAEYYFCKSGSETLVYFQRDTEPTGVSCCQGATKLLLDPS